MRAPILLSGIILLPYAFGGSGPIPPAPGSAAISRCPLVHSAPLQFRGIPIPLYHAELRFPEGPAKVFAGLPAAIRSPRVQPAYYRSVPSLRRSVRASATDLLSNPWRARGASCG